MMFRKLLDRFEGVVTPRDLAHVTAGILFCIAVLLLDMSTSSDIIEAFLLPPSACVPDAFHEPPALGMLTFLAFSG